MNEAKGYRGYIGSRAYQNPLPPQHVQNLVIRDYCARNGFTYLLSATEYAMPGCYVMLAEVLRELPEIAGVVMYSVFMLPAAPDRRCEVVETILAAGCTLHGAVENLAVRDAAGVRAMEQMLRISRLDAGAAADLIRHARGTRL
ncbi:MAG: LIC12192 family sporadic carbohydrate cluster protein [Alphaproteobacteria bacterium]